MQVPMPKVRLDLTKRGGAQFCHVEYDEEESVDRAIKLSGQLCILPICLLTLGESGRGEHLGLRSL